MKTLYLPALTGKFGSWRFFQVIFKIEDLIENFGDDQTSNYRVKTVDEVEEIYSRQGIGGMLQREFDKRRLGPIRKYLVEQSDRYINNLTIAMFGGDPEWTSIAIKKTGFDQLSEEDQEDFENSYGVVKLDGSETLFVLDGQHRIKGLREAVRQDANLLPETIAVTLIVHLDSDEGRERTRRLFTTVNRYAKPISKGEAILLDEDDLSAILTRTLIEEYPRFKGKSIIAKNKTANLTPKDKDKFTTVIQLWNINEMLIPHSVYTSFTGGKGNLVKIRPSDENIQKWKQKVFQFWDLFFHLFPNATAFAESPNLSARENGGPFSLRPIGQSIFCALFQKMNEVGKSREMAQYVKLFPDDLSDSFWHNILYDPIGKKMSGSESFARDYLFYLLNLPLKHARIKTLTKQYQAHKKDGAVQLPERILKEAGLFD